MDLSVNIAIGSSAQVALFVAPVLVLASYFIGPHRSPGLQRLRAGRDPARGRDRQLRDPGRRVELVEGVQLLAVYLVFGIAFYYA